MKLPLPLSVSLCLILALGSFPGLADNAAADYKQAQEAAQRLVKEGKLRDALPLSLKAAELNPKDPAVHETLSTIYSGLGDHTKAVAESRQVVALRPRDELAHYNLALSLQQLDQYSEALTEYGRAVDLGDRGLDAKLGESQCLLRLGRMTEAIRELEALSRQYPQRKDVWLNLSYAYLLYEDSRGAVMAADTALKLDPNYKPAIKFRAVLALRGNRFRTALTLARRLITAEPKNPEGYQLAGRIAAQTSWSEVAEAEWVLNEALKNVPGSIDTFLLLGTSCRRVAERPRPKGHELRPEIKQKWWLLSEKAFRHAVSVAPDQAQTNLALAELLVARRMYHEALPPAHRALELSHQSAAAQAAYKSALRAKNDLAGQFRLWFRSLLH